MSTDARARAYEILETRGDDVFAFSTPVQEQLDYLAEDLTTRRVTTASNRLLKAVQPQARITWEARHDCEEAIGVLFEEDLQGLDTLVGVTQSLMHQLTNTEPLTISQPMAYALSSIAVRAHATTHEISALLRAGLPKGAQARWRTLHELQVVAAVIGAGDENTAERYNEHRWYGFKEDRRGIEPKPPWPGETPEHVMDRLVKKYGRWFDKQYGWAQPEVTKLLHKNKAGVTTHDLRKIAELSRPHLDSVRTANHLIHADSLGVLHRIGSEGLLHAGGSLHDIPHVAMLTAATLADTIETTTDTWQRHDDSPHALSVAALAQHTLDEIQIRWARRVLHADIGPTPQP